MVYEYMLVWHISFVGKYSCGYLFVFVPKLAMYGAQQCVQYKNSDRDILAYRNSECRVDSHGLFSLSLVVLLSLLM